LLDFGHVDRIRCWIVIELVGHDDKVAFRGILVGLKLIVGGLVAGAASEKEQKFGRGVWIVGGFRNVAVYATKFGDLAAGFLARRCWPICCAVVLHSKYVAYQQR
jgi:hypothetical protein